MMVCDQERYLGIYGCYSNQKAVYSITQETGTLLARYPNTWKKNSLMPKEHTEAKEARDWLPLI